MVRFVPRFSHIHGDWYVFDTVCRDLFFWAVNNDDAQVRCDELNGTGNVTASEERT